MRNTRPEDLFRAEKERAQSSRNSQHARLLAEAKAAFDKLMAEGQAARKSGRPRKHPLPPLKTGSRAPSRTPTPAAPPAKPALAAPAAPAAKIAKVASPPKAVVKRTAKPAKVAKVSKPARANGGRKTNGKSAKAKGKAKGR